MHFNSRAHVERDQWRAMSRRLKRYFNSRAHVERDSFSRWYSPHPVTFQLTRSRGARLRRSRELFAYPNFNSRAHVERDISPPNGRILLTCISTHALTWSATRLSVAPLDKWGISTHALTWSATTSSVPDVSRTEISTHALTWSATSHHLTAVSY